MICSQDWITLSWKCVNTAMLIKKAPNKTMRTYETEYQV